MKIDYEVITPTKEHAEACVEFRKKVVVETDFLNSSVADLPSITLEDQLNYIQKLSDKEIYLMAIDKTGKILGMANASRKKKKMAHIYDIGCSVLKEYHGMGIGSAFMKEIVKQAKDKKAEKLILEVMTNNEKAIALYEKFGFKIEGTHPKAIKNTDGKYYDVYSMGLLL